MTDFNRPPRGYTPVSIGQMIRFGGCRAPHRTAIICEDQSRSYGDLTRRINRVAHAARALGLPPGSVAAIVAPNILEYIEVVAGLSDAGLVVATLNPKLTQPELSAIFEDCVPALVVAHVGAADIAAAVLPAGSRMIVLGSPYEAWIAQAADSSPPPVPEWDAFSISYTSGTTGRPKGVMLPHRSRVLTALASAAEYGCFGLDETFLSLTPLYHGAGFAFAVANLAFGGACRIAPRFDAEETMRLLGSGRITSVFVVPTLLKRLLDLPVEASAAIRRHDALKAIISNASALSQQLKEAAIDRFGERLLHETYGATEAGIVTNIRPALLRTKPGSVGLPFVATEIELRDEAGVAVADGVPGELFSRSPYLFAGYLNRPEETERTLVNGWVSVGDIAVRDEDGFYRIVDRKKDMIISGGVNIYPREIEDVLAVLPGVEEVAVVGVEDPEWGERIHAFVVPRRGSGPSITSLIEAAATRLTGHKRPKAFTLVDELPRNAGGKVLKTTLRQLAGRQAGSS